MRSWRSGTISQYQTYHKKWESFCCRRDINPLQATLQDGINFLGDLFATGVGYSCINTARSALSSIIVLPGSVHFGSHPLVTRFIKGVFETRPSLPRYKEIWDVNSVLKILANWTLGVELSLRDMSWKLTMLLAVLSGQRVQTLKALTLTSMTLTANRCVFMIDTPLKTTRPGKHLGRIEFLAHEPDRNLCVVQHLQAYIDRTSHLRGETDQLLNLAIRNRTNLCQLTLLLDGSRMSWPKQELTLVCIELTAQEELSHQQQRENRSLLTLSCLQQVGVMRAPLLGFMISLYKTLPKILGMSYCIIAVNMLRTYVFLPDLLTILLLLDHL